MVVCAQCNHNKAAQLQGTRIDGTLFHTKQRLKNVLSEFSSDTCYQLVLDPKTRRGDFRTTKPLISRDRYEAIRDNEDLYFD